MSRYEGKVCLITGGTSGIGFEISKRMAEEGGIIITCSIDKNIPEVIEKLKKITNNPNIEGYHCDVTKSEDRLAVAKEVEKKHGRIDVLVLNAGVNTMTGN